ncbi:MAG: DUF1553 domain-containing protein [Pirellulaceae bacterium]
MNWKLAPTTLVWSCLVVAAWGGGVDVLSAADDGAEPSGSQQSVYQQHVADDQPVAVWSFEEATGKETRGVGHAGDSATWPGLVSRAAKLGGEGPRPAFYPQFDAENRALDLSGGRGHVRVTDPGDDSPLDFSNGDAITLEAWVQTASVAHNQQVYVVGKGRTGNAGFAAENQNYALRIRGVQGQNCLSFLFRSQADPASGASSEYHRWNSSLGFSADGRWHHVAVTYEFGKPESIRGYIDGQATAGDWDYAGPTARPPVVDNDELWIGSAMGGNSSAGLNGMIDEVAIYRRALSAETLAARYVATLPKPKSLAEQLAELPSERIVVELREHVPENSWSPEMGEVRGTFSVPAFGFVRLPQKYDDEGLRVDRPGAYLIQARLKRTMAAGTYRFLLRSLNGARLLVDGREVARTPFINRNGSGHEHVPELADPEFAEMHPLLVGHREVLVDVDVEEGERLFTLEAMIGGKGLRDEVGELCVALAPAQQTGTMFELLAPSDAEPITLHERDWRRYAEQSQSLIAELDSKARRTAAANQADFWQQRHAWARDVVEQKTPLDVPASEPDYPELNTIDRFINARLAEAGVEPSPLTDDFAFLRRTSLDVRGVLPTQNEIREFLADESADRRARWIDRLLNDPRWADNWVGYWQDVLAENPGILKPELNNTGPFRWWIHESLLDNKPMDRFVAELVVMNGSRYGGGPAGFSMATQNDVPMAAKAHVVAKAFLGLDMTCARCHDAPYHPFKQSELFGLAAMLNRQAIKLPSSSSVPQTPGGRKPLVDITLKPGESVAPQWSFVSLTQTDLPASALRSTSDDRERLAALITSPTNDRFARMLVNRVWHRYLGEGIVASVDDWHEAEPSHAELLDYLGREFVASGYDLKYVARLILNSHAYQRAVASDESSESSAGRLFASPKRRRMDAEQIVDSLFAVSGKPMESEPLTLDPEARRPVTTFLNLGVPTRGWELTSLSNERDRPALALPVAQSIIDVLAAFGWRDARPNPITERESYPTVLQPLTLAHGSVVNRVCQLSDNSEFTELCLQDVSLDRLIDDIYLRILSRLPNSDERAMAEALLAEGYEQRRLPNGQFVMKPPLRTAVSWSNHLSAEATTIKLELEKAARAGDPPSGRLDASWRERMEDFVWALVNSPEFVFVP